MVDFIEVCRRATTGSMMSQKDYDLKLFIPTLRKVLKKYNIKWNRKEVINTDDEFADRVFTAAIDFYSEVGTYIIDTERVINFSKSEILEAIEDAPKEAHFGEGEERCVMKGNFPDTDELVHCHAGSGTITSYEYALKLVEAYARIEKAKTLSVPIVDNIKGVKSSGGSPVEVLAGIECLRIAREGCKLGGRPGLAISSMISSCSSGGTTIAASAPQFGGRPTDGWLIAPSAELKIDYSELMKVPYLMEWGANIGQEQGPVLGGYCGGPEGLAVVNTAYVFHGILVARANYHITYPIHINYVCSSVPDVLWPTSISIQAIGRNIYIPYYSLLYTAAGAATKMFFYEALANILVLVSSGAGVEDPHPGKAKIKNGATPIDSEYSCELVHALKGITRKEANKIIDRVIPKYIEQIPNPPMGETVDQCYDLDRLRPKPHFEKLYYDEIVKELKDDFGIELYKH